MINPVHVFFKHQYRYLLLLFSLFSLPLGLFLQFSPYQLPKVQYVALGALYVSQFIFFKEKDFHQKINKKITKYLQGKLGRVPSQKEVHSYCMMVSRHRGISILVTTLEIIALMIYFQEF